MRRKSNKFSLISLLELSDLKYTAYQIENRTNKILWSFIRSQRGAPLLVHSGFVYRCERKISNKTYWLCLNYKKTKCNGRMILEGNQINKMTEHNHSIDKRSTEGNIELKNLDDEDVDLWIKAQ